MPISATTASIDSPRPFLKWAGGKGQLLAQYQQHFPTEFSTYYEAFLGGGAVFFALKPSRAVLTDVNPALVNVYRCIQSDVEAVIDLLTHYQQQHSKEHYYQIRSTAGNTAIEQAARFIYLNRTCFNGLYRENSKGEFNVPIGRYKNPRICYPDVLRSASVALQSAQLQVESFEAVLNSATAQDFVYFDPPYYPISQTSRFTAYSRFAFTEQSQIQLRDTFAALANRGVKVMLSNSDCEFIRDLYAGFQIHTIAASRAINSNAQRRGKITEVLITSY
ncbi:DNA adenine methylase [Microcoleus sp. FACHB-1515]|uniref:DNA adenine methylase n=1 Tax=Cyanophyceae TaxID=3028117 RepID=UPI0016877488|nr:DNA adenine methylase [Microcoleus sp. FACHB-1515]MBD2091011.1 DNA adenine methylase [Microcoleus sp. FACHB-1515]